VFPVKQPWQGQKIGYWSNMMKKTTILSQGDKMQLRNKLRLGTWNIRSKLQLGKVQLLGE